MSSSPMADPVGQWPGTASLVQVLKLVPDPRARRGIRHALPGIVAVALAAVLAGARSFAAIGQWAGELTGAQLAELGLSRPRAPDASTFRKVLARVEAAVLDQLVGAFLWARTRVVGGRRVIAIDGKTVRGARTAAKAAPHLVSAFDQATGTVLGQLATAANSNEIPTVRTLLASFDLSGVVVTVDAMHTQTDTATLIVDAGGDYVFTVKANQFHLYAACKKLPWREVSGHSSVSTGHGRRVRRTIKVVAAPAWITFTGAAQVAQIRRGTTSGPGRVGPGPLGDREPCPLGPRCRLRRGPLPSPHRQRTPGDGHPAQHRDRPAPPIRRHQHRRQPATSRRQHRTADHAPTHLMKHIIAHLKNWKILSHRYRGPLDKLGEVIRAIVALHFFRYS